jgi:hypothetical protein
LPADLESRNKHRDEWAIFPVRTGEVQGYIVTMKDALTTNDLPESPRDPGYVLHVSDRTAAAMQLAAHFTAQSMALSATVDPRARLAEQLSYFDLAFRAIMSSTARTMIKTPAPNSDGEVDGRRVTNEFRVS